MKYQIVGKNISITEGIDSAIKKTIDKVDKYLKYPDRCSCRVVVRSYKVGAKIEVTIYKDTNIIVRAEEYSEDLYIAIGQVLDKLEKQIKRVNTKIKNKEKTAFVIDKEVNSVKDEFKVSRIKDVSSEYLEVEEAIIQMESLGHNFFLYVDKESHRPSVVYKKEDNTYGKLQLMIE